MSTLFGILTVGRNGMMAHQVASQTASHNATNAATPGYTRRMANIESVDGPPEPGLGSRARGARRVIDPYLERRLLGARSSAGKLGAQTNALAVLDHLFSDTDVDVGASLDALTQAFSDLSNHPHDSGARQAVLGRASQLGDSFRYVADEMTRSRGEINERIAGEVDAVNQRLHRIAELGAEITKLELTGSEAGNLRDARDVLVREVADRIPVKVIEKDDGTLNLLYGGSFALVTPEGEVNMLERQLDPGTGDVLVQVEQAGQRVDLDVDDGAIGGLFDARDTLATSQAGLDQLAFDVMSAYNTAHQAGFGLDGVGGRDLFAPPAGVAGAASNFRLSAAVAGNPDAIAAASDAAMLPGDNRAALDLAAVADGAVALGGTATALEGYVALVGAAATQIQQATLQQESADAAVDQVEALRDAVSGVSVDEAMVDLMQFQRGFQASMTVIQTADEMLQELMNLKR